MSLFLHFRSFTLNMIPLNTAQECVHLGHGGIIEREKQEGAWGAFKREENLSSASWNHIIYGWTTPRCTCTSFYSKEHGIPLFLCRFRSSVKQEAERKSQGSERRFNLVNNQQPDMDCVKGDMSVPFTLYLFLAKAHKFLSCFALWS